MKIPPLQKSIWVYSLLGLFTAVPLLQVIHTLRLRSELQRIKDEQQLIPVIPNKDNSSTALEDFVNLNAKKAGIQRLLSLGKSTSKDSSTIQMEWEGNLPALFQFVRQIEASGRLGHCRALQITSLETNPAHVRARSTWGKGAVPNLTVQFSVPNEIPTRPVFMALWRTPVVSVENQRFTSLRKEEDQRREDQQRLETERKAREESDRLAAKRRQLETNLILTGIVNNGREPLAFVNNRGTGGTTMMLRSGDVVDEARVTNIQAARGEIELDYLGKFQVSLKINAGSSGAFQ